MNRFFTRHSFKIIILVVFLLPVLSRGTRLAMTSNDNKVEDWLPKEYPETQDLKWFKQHFDNETFILISWEGCTLDDPRLELFETKLLAHENKIYPKPRTLIQAGWQKLFPPAQLPDPVIGPPMFQSVETGRTMLDRLTEGTSKLSEQEALRRLAGLFVGKENHDQSCAVISLTAEGKRDLRHTLDSLYAICRKRSRPVPRAGPDGRAAGRQRGHQHRGRTDAGAAVRAGRHRRPVPGLLVLAQHPADHDGLRHRAVRRRHQPVDGLLFRQRDERHPADDARGGLRGRHLRGDPFCQLLSRFGGEGGGRGGAGPRRASRLDSLHALGDHQRRGPGLAVYERTDADQAVRHVHGIGRADHVGPAVPVSAGLDAALADEAEQLAGRQRARRPKTCALPAHLAADSRRAC